MLRTSRDLLRAAQDCGLIDEQQAVQAQSELDTARLTSARQAAEALVEKQSLSRFQVEQLLSGQGSECLIGERYRLSEKLGEGAMGAVYRADDLRLDRQVAVKVLPAHSLHDSDAVARFQREAKALARLSHPNIVQAFDVGEDRGRHYVVMEYVAGKNLHQFVREHGPLSPSRAADCICQAAIGLHHAHEKGLVHRDLKPSNLLLTPDRQVKIVDLGLARFFQDRSPDDELTHTAMGMGTPDYMPPEQFRDARAASRRTDIYSLGCSFYYLLTGEPPFPGGAISDKYSAHESRLPPIEAKCPDAPEGLVEVMLRMMAKQPEARYATALDAAMALEPHIARGSLSSVQIKATASWSGGATPRRAQRATRKWRMLVLAAALATVALAMVGAAAVGTKLLEDRAEKRPRQAVAGDSRDSAAATAPSKEATLPKATSPPLEKDVLTVAQDPELGAQFTSLNAALEKVRPGMTVRVLDRAAYDESIEIADATRFANVTIDSPQGATCQPPAGSRFGFMIHDVPGVTVRGLTLSCGNMAVNGAYLHISGKTAGVRLEKLRFTPPSSIATLVWLESIDIRDDEPPLVIEWCELSGSSTCDSGIRLIGGDDSVSRRVRISDNRIHSAARGVISEGSVQQVHIVGNLFWSCFQAGISLADPAGKTEGVLVANNTVFGGTCGFRAWDREPHESFHAGQIEIRGNLFFDADAGDFVYVHVLGEAFNPLPGAKRDSAKLYQAWRVGDNWRDGSGSMTNFLLDTAPADHLNDQWRFVSRDPAHPDFMRPADDAPYASGGAGRLEDSLPSYAGAIPPSESDRWDWRKTWDARQRSASP